MSLTSQRIEQDFLRHARVDPRIRRAYVVSSDLLHIVVELKRFTVEAEIELRHRFICIVARHSPDVFHDERDYALGDLSVTA